MTRNSSINDLINRLPEHLNLKARSLLMTIWGDSIAPHGGTVWLGSLIDLVDGLGLNERVVRTSVYRLKKEQLLTSKQEGRRSFYTLTPTGQHRFEEATKRIYNHQPSVWDGGWTLLFTERRKLSDEKKRQLRMELGWLGFGDLGTGIYAHPNCTANSATRILEDLQLQQHVAILNASELPATSDTPIHILVQKGWDLEEIESGYTEFINHFAPIGEKLKTGCQLNDKICFILRSLLVHDYRRALLRDPMLPEQLLPAIWNGNRARDLFREIYLDIWQGAEKFLMQKLETDTGTPPEASREFRSRFGGLEHEGDAKCLRGLKLQ